MHFAGWRAQKRNRSRVTSSAAPAFEGNTMIVLFHSYEKADLRCMAAK
jgi:hypothetical protein